MEKIFPVVAAVIGLIVAFCLASWIKKTDEGTDRMKEIAGYIREGAMAFLAREYKTMVIVVVVLFLVIGFALQNWTTAVLYLCGAALSVLAGFFGMKVATLGNVRTANAARESGMNKALKIAFRSGAVMGLCVSGLGLFGLGVVLCALDLATVVECVTGFGLGASSMALFGRVGGGIYTKAADVGADLVGKVEAGIPEDDPRNPAVIADNVGDNVGDVAGTGFRPVRILCRFHYFRGYTGGRCGKLRAGDSNVLRIRCCDLPADYFGDRHHRVRHRYSACQRQRGWKPCVSLKYGYVHQRRDRYHCDGTPFQVHAR